MESQFFKSFSGKIMDIPDEEYHNNKDYLSASSMKLLKKSPMHYREHEQETTDAMVFGSAYHCFILEEDKFKDRYFILDESEILSILLGEGSKSPRATNKYKEWKENQLTRAEGKILLDDSTFLKMQKMKRRLFQHPFAKMLLTNGEPELAIFAEFETFDGTTGKAKIKPDNIKRKKRVIVDLKTCNSAALKDFPRHAADLDYHIQAAYYKDVIEQMEGTGLPWRFMFVAQEKEAPYAFNIFEAGPQFIGQGRYEYEMLIGLFDWCKTNDKWPGYQVFCDNKYGVLELGLPAYKVQPLDYFTHNIF